VSPEPNAALIDAGALVGALFAARIAVLWLAPPGVVTRWAARWLRRGVMAALLVPALRLLTLAIGGGDRVPLLVAACVAILASGVALALLDEGMTDWLAARRRA
jgi:hypothetical protein